MVRNERTAFAFRVLQGSTGSHAKTTVFSCWTLLLREAFIWDRLKMYLRDIFRPP